MTIPWSFLNQDTRTRLLGLRDISPDDRTWFFARAPSSALDFFVSGTLAWLFEPLGRPLFLLRSMLPNSVFFRGNPEGPLVSSCPSYVKSVRLSGLRLRDFGFWQLERSSFSKQKQCCFKRRLYIGTLLWKSHSKQDCIRYNLTCYIQQKLQNSHNISLFWAGVSIWI